MHYQESQKPKAISFMLISSFCFAFMAAFVKLAGDIPAMEKAFFRNLVSLIIALSMLRAKRQSVWGKKENRRILLLRGITGSIGVIFFFYGIDHLILADSAMLNKLSPFFVILFAWLILKNPIKPVQIISVLIALGGAALIIKPGFHFSATLPALICFCSAIAAGLAYTMVSYLGNKENSYTIVFYFSLISSLICLPLALASLVIPSWSQLVLLLGAGIMAAGGQFLLTSAYRYAPAGDISIYQYTNIIFSSILGMLFFSELPDYLSITGFFLILTAGFLIYKNGKANKIANGKAGHIKNA